MALFSVVVSFNNKKRAYAETCSIILGEINHNFKFKQGTAIAGTQSDWAALFDNVAFLPTYTSQKY